ncbi:MAG: hypothetical protein ABI467_17115 [Kofleriaceae bacterium]
MRVALLVFAACSAPAAAVERDAALVWPRYTIAPGDHDSQLSDREPKDPTDGVTSAVGRDYELVLDPSAVYVLTMPVEPQDQLDWNKLPGLSDCNETDLSREGAMFGWRWNIDQAVVEITAYANNASVHLETDPLVTLSVDDLAVTQPLHYRIAREQTDYAFSITGEINGRAIAASGTLPRRCVEVETDPLAWASGFYFGGTSTAPQTITARIHEYAF